MENSTKKFLQFNGKNVYFLSAAGVWWIAIKPICEALGVEYTRQFKNLKSDEILGPALAVQPMQVDKNQMRNYACLPEYYVYGWLFSIQSQSQQLQQYKWKCYEILYNYFHGTITERSSFLKVRTQTDIEIERLESELLQNDTYKKIQDLKIQNTAAKKALIKLDNEVINNQMQLWGIDPEVGDKN